MKVLLLYGKQETYEAYQTATPIQELIAPWLGKAAGAWIWPKNKLTFGVIILSPYEFRVHLKRRHFTIYGTLFNFRI